MRDGRVNKLVEVKGLELYCSTFQSTDEVMRDYAVDSNSKGRESEANDDKYMLVPLDVSLSLSVCESDTQPFVLLLVVYSFCVLN